MYKLLTETNSPVISPIDQWELRWETVKSPLREDVVNEYLGKFDPVVLRSGDEQLKDEWPRWREDFKGRLLETEKRLYVYGPAQVADKRNGNGRIYPSRLWDRVLAPDSPFMQRLKARQVLGELEHPEEANTKLPRVSHLVERVDRKGDIIYAGHLIFRTPRGQIVEELYRCSVTPGVSSRAMGMVRSTPEGDIVEEEGFVLDTFDFVYLPSVPIARPSPVEEKSMRESVSYPGDFLVLVDRGGNLVMGPVPSVVPVEGLEIRRLGEMSEKWLERYGIKISSSDGRIRVMAEQMVNEERIKAEARNVALAQAVLEETPVQFEGLSFDELLKHYDRLSEVLRNLEPYKGSVDGSNVFGRVQERLELVRLALEESRRKEKERLDSLVQEQLDNLTKELESSGGKGKSGDGEEEASVREAESKVRSRLSRLARVRRELGRRRESLFGGDYRTRYEAAVELGEHLVEEARRIKEGYEEAVKKSETAIKLGERLVEESKRRIRALEDLLSAVVERYRKEGVVRYLLGLTNEYPQLKNSIEAIARKCESISEAKELVESVIKPVASRSQYPVDLPPVGVSGTSLTEERGRLRESVDLMSMVVRRFEGRR